MDKLLINGPCKLNGSVEISKAKNAYLPIMCGVLLTKESIRLQKVPALRDINTMNSLLSQLGVKIEKEGRDIIYTADSITSQEATYDLVKTMRASITVLGPLLARFHHAKVSLPGGCAIGSRPVNLHLENLAKLGAEINIESGYVEAKTNGLKGAHLVLDFPSVGATENLMMAATLAEGTTIMENCALEPEVSDLAYFLKALGANISGIGTKTITIEGVAELGGCDYEAIGDRIEAATYVLAGLMTNSEITVTGFNPAHIEFILEKLVAAGAMLEIGDDFVKTKASTLKGLKLDTAPYPGFPTDVQAQIIALCTQIPGASVITENIFENRFMHIPELKRLGAQISLKGKSAFIEGGNPLKAAPIMCTDLRASAALVLTALCAEGETEIQRIYHLDRGYEKLDEKFSSLGAKIQRVK